jgi:hypothetical protein
MFLVVLCASSTLLLVEDALTRYRKRRPHWSVTRLAGITFWSLAFSYWIDIPWFLTEGKLAAVLITPSLGVPNWPVIYIINYMPVKHQQVFWHHSTPRHQKVFWCRCRGKRRLLQGEFRTHILYFVLSFASLYFYLFHFIKNTKN